MEAQERCLALCRANKEATGCLVIWGKPNRGCWVHTKSIAKGNGGAKHYCWVFSKCKGIYNDICRLFWKTNKL